MGRYTARLVKLSRFDERAALVFDGVTGIPADTPSSFLVISELGHTSHNTVLFRAMMVAQLYNWGEKFGIDFNERFATGEAFSFEEISSLNDYLTLDHSVKKVKPLRVAVGTHKKKIGTIIRFFEWMRDRYYLKRAVGDRMAESMKERVNIAISRLQAKVGSGGRISRLGLTEEEQRALLEAIRPNNPNSLFKDYNRERNYLLFLMLFVTGIRISELLKLTLIDIHLEGGIPFIHVTHQEHVPDPRKNKAVLKTEPRDIQISGDLARLIQQFISGGRKFRKSSRKARPFLFLNSRIDVSPLSRNQIYSIVRLIKDSNPLLSDLKPHRLRHTWNDNFDRVFEKSGVTEIMQTRVKNYLCGWTPVSKQGESYNLRSVVEMSKNMSLDLQAKMFESLGGGK